MHAAPERLEDLRVAAHNPVGTAAAYGGDASAVGTEHDPLVGQKVVGVNVSGGGLTLYGGGGRLLGALGVSGDSSCADHNAAWKLRHEVERAEVARKLPD